MKHEMNFHICEWCVNTITDHIGTFKYRRKGELYEDARKTNALGTRSRK